MQNYVHGYELTEAWTSPGKIRRQMRAFSENTVEWHQQTIQYDMMRDYRNTLPAEHQDQIWDEVGDKLEERDRRTRGTRRTETETPGLPFGVGLISVPWVTLRSWVDLISVRMMMTKKGKLYSEPGTQGKLYSGP